MMREIPLAEVNPSHAESLLHAARVDAQLNEPAFMNILDVVTTSSELGLVYDYVEAETLRGLQSLCGVRRKTMPLDIALRIATDLLEAASRMHSGIGGRSLFGGLSPDRILVGTDGRTRLVDIGVASVANSVEAFGQHPERIAYAAPEQVGGGQVADARTDLFTIGILLWEMLSNRRLFIGSDQAVAQKVIAAKIPRLDQVKRRGDSDVPDDIVSLVARALERDRNARHQSAEEMLSDLRGIAPPAEHAEVGQFVEMVSEGALERRRDAIKDETRGRSFEPLSKSIKPDLSAPKQASPSVGKGTQIGMPAFPRAPAPARPLPPPSLPQAKPSRMKTIVGIPIAPITSGAAAPAAISTHPKLWSGAIPKPRVDQAIASAPKDLVPEIDDREVESRNPTADALRAALTAEEDADSVRRERERQRANPPLGQPQDWDDDFVTTTTATAPGFAEGPERTPPPLARAPRTEPSFPDLPTVPLNAEPTIPASLPPSDPEAGATLGHAADYGDLTEPDLASPRVPDVAATPKIKAAMLDSAPTFARRAPTGASLPPAAIFPSQIPPPLIHDPRANFRPSGAEAQQKPRNFARGVIAGTLGTFVVIALGVGLGLVIMRSRQPQPENPPLPEPQTAPAVAETHPMATAETPTASAVPSTETTAEAQTNATDAGAETAPAASASASASPSASAPLPEAKTAARKAPAPAPRRVAPRRSKPRKFTPDDI